MERNVLAPTIEFLRRHAPFERMAPPHLEFLAKHVRIGFYAKGEVILEPARGVTQTFFIVKQGRVRGALESGRMPSDDGGVWELEPGECFPVGAMLGHRQVVMKHVAVEDTFCFELGRDDFDKLLSLSPVFRDFCTRRLSSLLAETLRGMQVDAATQSNEASFNTSLRDLVRRAPVSCAPGATVAQAVARMHAERVGSIVVTDAAGAPLGIFTLHDLLGRVAARNLSFDTPVTQVMTPRPYSVTWDASVYEAMTLMARHGFGHLCIVDNGKLAGVISERDLFSLQRIGLVHLTRSITQAADVETLARLGRDARRLAEHMLAQGVSVSHLVQLIALLNDHIGRRVIALCSAEHGPTVPFTWLSFGSEGRQEQTLKTDQDNGILFRVPPGRTAESVRAELLPLAQRINNALACCGYPLCPGNVMAGNPECCLSLEEWRDRFATWIDRGEPEHLLKASIYFDIRVLEGDTEPVEELRRWLLEHAAAMPRFLRQMAQNALRNQPPLGLIREFVVEEGGAHANAINLKLRGASPFVDGARLLALAHGISETNTLARMRAAARLGVVREAEANAWCDAYLFIQMLRMRRHQAQERAGQPLDNYVDPDHLNELDRRVLKEAFRQARKLQSAISLDYGL